MCTKFSCSVFGNGTQPFDFITRNEIQKLADEDKYITKPKTLYVFGQTSTL